MRLSPGKFWVQVVCICLQGLGLKLCAFVSRKILGSSCVLLSPGRFWVQVVCICFQEDPGIRARWQADDTTPAAAAESGRDKHDPHPSGLPVRQSPRPAIC